MQGDFSRNVYKVIDVATNVARRLGCRYIGSEHLMYALMTFEEGRASAILKEAKANPTRYFEILSRNVEKDLIIMGNMFTPRTKRVFEDAIEISIKARAGFVSTEHLLLAILMMGDCFAVKILESIGVDTDLLVMEIANAMFPKKDSAHQDGEDEEDELASTFTREINQRKSADKKRAECQIHPVKTGR
jgi:ATP-dependent Clp protease ATP-binding subunit ClpC